MEHKKFALLTGRLTSELPPGLGDAVKSAVGDNPYLHHGSSRAQRAARRAQARAAMLARAKAGDKQAAAAIEVTKRLCDAQKGNEGPARELLQKFIARGRGTPSMGGWNPTPQLSGVPELSGARWKKRLKKAALGPLLIGQKIKKIPFLRKGEAKLQKAVGKALPFTKPFIAAHNKLDKALDKGLSKAGKKMGAKGGKGLIAAARKAALGKLGNGTYQVILPTGKRISVPASKVVGA